MKRKTIWIILVLSLCTNLAVPVLAAMPTVARPTSSAVFLNGESIAFDAYSINDNNYFRLRDIAYALSGTEKQFDIDWDGENNAITLSSGQPYTMVGGEMVSKGAGEKAVARTNSIIYLDGRAALLRAYNIEGNNYFKLRDLGRIFDFGVDWDGASNAVLLDTDKRYTFTPVNAELYSLIYDTCAVSGLTADMTDAEIISMFETALYKNAYHLWKGWIMSGNGLDLDKNSFLPETVQPPDWVPAPGSHGGWGPTAYEVINMKSIDEVKANIEAFFSLRFCESFIYPTFIEGDFPLYVEVNGKLFYTASSGEYSVIVPDFTRAEVKSKSESSFEIEVPMIVPVDPDWEEETFVYKVIQQNGNWVLDNLYSYYAGP